MALAAPEPDLVEVVWRCIRANSWVSPQLAVAVKSIDADYSEHARSVMTDPSIGLKAKGAVAAQLPAGAFDPGIAVSGKEGFAIAQLWSLRLDTLTEPLEPVSTFD